MVEAEELLDLDALNERIDDLRGQLRALYDRRRGMLALEMGAPGKRGHFTLWYCTECGQTPQPSHDPICVLCRQRLLLDPPPPPRMRANIPLASQK